MLTGIVTTLLGPILPILSARWSLLDTQAGYLFTAQFAGSMLGVGSSSLVVPRFGYRRSLFIGFFLMSAGVATLELPPWPAALASVFCYGLGLGLVIPSTNLIVAEHDPGRRSAALNILNFAWGLGAVACPALAGLAIRIHQSTGFFLTLAAATSFVALGYAGRPLIETSYETTPQSLPAVPLRTLSKTLIPRTRDEGWRRGVTPVFTVIFFLYVGTENAISGWAAAYAKRVGPGVGTTWVFAPSFFWVALLVGRAAAPAVLRWVADARLRVFGLVTAGCGNFILLVSNSPPGIFAGVALVGLGLAPVFPLVIAALSDCFGANASRVAGGMFALGGLGGATLPWLVGFLSTRYGSLRFALAVPLASVLMMILLEFSRFKIPARTSLPA